MSQTKRKKKKQEDMNEEENPFFSELRKYAEKYELPIPDPEKKGEDLKNMLKNVSMSDFLIKDLDRKFKGGARVRREFFDQ